MPLRRLIREIGTTYDRRLPMSSEAQKVLRHAGAVLEQWIPADHVAEGSGGKGRAAVTPRIAVFDPRETTTVRRGMYVAYLFAADMSTVALTLNQGVSGLAGTIGRARARRALLSEAAAVRAALDTVEIADLDTAVDLRSTAESSVDYQFGTILARTYRLRALPSESTMVADLQRFIRLYALAVTARDKGRRKGKQGFVTPAPLSPTGERAARAPDRRAGPQADSDDESRRTSADREDGPERPTAIGERRSVAMTRRSVLTALVVLPTALTRVSQPGTSADVPHLDEPGPQFTVDVSQHDWRRRGGNLDWAAIRDAGIAGMAARATYGDPSGYHFPTYHFGDFVRAAEAAGFGVRGGYHNLVRGDTASINRQVDWLRRELDAHDANWAMLDVERYAELVTSGMWPRWEDVRRFDDRWAEVDGRVLVGYIPPWNWRAHLGRPDLREFQGPLIASHYPLETSDEYRMLYVRCGGDSGRGWAAYGNRVPHGWQFTPRARVPGGSHVTDVNAWRMTSRQLAALLTGGEMAAGGSTGGTLV